MMVRAELSTRRSDGKIPGSRYRQRKISQGTQGLKAQDKSFDRLRVVSQEGDAG